MKIILSRKGTDSSAGGLASPIFPDGRLLSLPIPQADGPVRYSQLHQDNLPLSRLIKQLGGKQWRSACHLDPDIDPRLKSVDEQWLPAFGQSGSAQRHLEQEGVGVGDLFLFFGWFREVEKVRGRWQFRPGAADMHHIYGWLQVGEIATPDSQLAARFPQLQQHPHLVKDYPFNTLYLPTPRLTLPGGETDLPGSGCFNHHRPELKLTREGATRSVWRLPPAFWPDEFEQALSYHRQPWRWQQTDEEVVLQAAARGQEFVLDLAFSGDIAPWLEQLFRPLCQAE
ncbi:Nmad3 family putative nucleotide modification protein [Marinobacterium jannaschii]|uniref:Nmad3 family putative nucleotide modification protein n=1 Tax=Marinobacterium jannaschii TaxID=64970 RepID=UPI000486C96F|nr:hypothetical protein [Marinobacterium jannaschii]